MSEPADETGDYLIAQFAALAAAAVTLLGELVLTGLIPQYDLQFVGILAPSFLVMSYLVQRRQRPFSRAAQASASAMTAITCSLAAVGLVTSSIVATCMFPMPETFVFGLCIGALFCVLPAIIASVVGTVVYRRLRK